MIIEHAPSTISPTDTGVIVVPDKPARHRQWYYLLLALPPLLATSTMTWADKGVPLYVAAGVLMLFPAAIVLHREGWVGAFSAVALVSLTAYFLYNHNVIVQGDALVPSQKHAYPAIGTRFRDRAAMINLAGCAALVVGLLAFYKRHFQALAYRALPRGRIFISDITLRNAVFFILAAYIGVRFYLMIRGGYSPLDFLLGSRSRGSYLQFAGDFIFLAHLANVFQVTALVGGALLLARRGHVPFARSIALAAVLIPIVFVGMKGTRGHTVTFMAALLAFAITIPVPRVQRAARRLVPLVVVFGALVFAALTVYRDAGFAGEQRNRKDTDISEGFDTLLEYDQATMLEQCLYVTPDNYPTLKGRTLLALPVNFVPRYFWPQKPVALGPILAERLGLGQRVTLSAGLIGEGWMNFELLGAVLLPLIYGLGVSAWDRLRGVATRWPDGFALWAAGLPGLVVGVRGDFLTGGALFMYSAAGTAMMLLFLARVAHLPRAGEAPAMEYPSSGGLGRNV